MRLHLRHYLLIALIFGVFAFNLWRRHRVQNPAAPTPVQLAPTAPPADTPAWRAFDRTAQLRDAPAPVFEPALDDLHQQLKLAASDPASRDIPGCATWLDFYRQATTHPVKDHQWAERSARHLDSCVKYHADTTAS